MRISNPCRAQSRRWFNQPSRSCINPMPRSPGSTTTTDMGNHGRRDGRDAPPHHDGRNHPPPARSGDGPSRRPARNHLAVVSVSADHRRAALVPLHSASRRGAPANGHAHANPARIDAACRADIRHRIAAEKRCVFGALVFIPLGLAALGHPPPRRSFARPLDDGRTGRSRAESIHANTRMDGRPAGAHQCCARTARFIGQTD